MAHKYLDDIGYDEYPENYTDASDDRNIVWQEERRIYGFDNRDTWSLNNAYYCWMFEHLKMYIDQADGFIDLNYHKFDYNGNEYTQKELILLLLENIEYILFHQDDMEELEWTKLRELEREVADIWYMILPAMWW